MDAGKIFKWGAIIVVVWIAIRWLGGLTANVAGSLQPGTYSAPMYPYYPQGQVLMSQGLVGSLGQWRGPVYGPGNGRNRWRRQ